MLITRRALIAGAVVTPLAVDAYPIDELSTLGHQLDPTWALCKSLEEHVNAISEEAAKRCDLAEQSGWDELQSMRTTLGYGEETVEHKESIDRICHPRWRALCDKRGRVASP